MKQIIPIIVLIVLMAIAGTGGVLLSDYHRGAFMGPKMPTNSEELVNWSAGDLRKLERSLKCDDVPRELRTTEPKEFTYWRNTCKMVERYWVKAYRKEKVNKGLEIFNKLDLPR